MPVKKKKTARGRVGRTSKNSCKAVGSRRTVGGKSFKIKSYSKTKTAAKKAAENHRKKGAKKLARVVEVTCGGKKMYQVLTRG